jgi:Glyoxalase-like domain
MKGIDHLVLCGRDVDEMRKGYEGLGFKLTPPAQHPFGTRNSLVQLDRVFLELLSLGKPENIPAHGPSHFSFAAFNRDFLKHGEGFSMLVLDSDDARKDVADYRKRGLTTYEPFDFRRKAKLAQGQEAVVRFSLAFVTSPAMPMCGFFCCQQHTPQYFWQRQYQDHSNRAKTVLEVALVAERPQQIRTFLEKFIGARATTVEQGFRIATRRGDVAAMIPEDFAKRYGSPPPDLSKGPRFGGYTIGMKAGSGRAQPAGKSVSLFGTAIRFEPLTVAAQERRG